MIKRMVVCVLVLATLLMPVTIASAGGTQVTRCDARLRKAANTSSDTLATVPGGTEVSVLGTSGGWTKTSFKGHTGYIANDLLMELTRSGYYPLKPGDENPYVKEMQKRLIELGYMQGPADGAFGDSTKDAVILFQKNHRMTQDGIAGGETQRVLFSDSAKPAPGASVSGSASTSASSASAGTSVSASTATASSSTLRLNDRGEDVRKVQARLIELGYMAGKADGIFGKATEDAVVAFQKRANLTADGKAGQVTQNLLFSSAAPLSASATSSTAATTAAASGAAADYDVLKRGMTNNNIKKMQEKLKALGYFASNATGYFGSQTYEAVVGFQKAHNLKADGIAGGTTQQLLYSADAKAASTGASSGDTKNYPTLKEGMKSSAVTTMQKKLRDLGYLKAEATGYFGSNTKTAVIAFQKGNSLVADGVAGNVTLNLLYGSGAISASSSASSSTSAAAASSGGSLGAGKIQGPAKSSVKLLHWFQEVKPMLTSSSVLQIYDPATGYGWKLKSLSPGRHFDSEPLTAEDTTYMNAAFGGVTTWTPKPVWVKLPNGTWTLATMHNTPHLSGNIANNNFDGHLCVHFLRDMNECRSNDPNYGVQHQNAIRAAWKALTGQVVD